MRRFSFTCFIIASLLTGAAAQKVTLPPADFQAALKANPKAQLLDLRGDDEFFIGHLKKARNFDYRLDAFEGFVTSNYNKKEPLYIYCYTATRSSEALTFLNEIGFVNVIELEKGFANWTSESLPYVSKRLDTAPVAVFTMDNLRTMVHREEILVVDFYANWCVTCKDMKPLLKRVEKETKGVRSLTVNSERSEDIVAHYRITEIPTYIVFKNGRQVWRGSGSRTPNQLKQLVQ